MLLQRLSLRHHPLIRRAALHFWHALTRYRAGATLSKADYVRWNNKAARALLPSVPRDVMEGVEGDWEVDKQVC